MILFKYILIAVGLLIAGYHSIMIWDHVNKKADREYELTLQEKVNNRRLDSLADKIRIDSLVIAQLLEAKEQEPINRVIYATNKRQRENEIYTQTTDINKQYNDNFILNFKPKY